MSNHLQICLQRQHILLSYWSALGLEPSTSCGSVRQPITERLDGLITKLSSNTTNASYTERINFADECRRLQRKRSVTKASLSLYCTFFLLHWFLLLNITLIFSKRRLLPSKQINTAKHGYSSYWLPGLGTLSQDLPLLLDLRLFHRFTAKQVLFFIIEQTWRCCRCCWFKFRFASLASIFGIT